LTLALWVGGCGSNDDGGGADGAGAGQQGGTVPAGTTPADGTSSTPGSAGSDATTGTPGAGTGMTTDGVAGAAGAGSEPAAPGDSGAAGATGGASDPVADDGTGSGADEPAMGEFMECVSGIDNWGTEMQAGPCGSGTTRYGVKIEYGPYGASMVYNVGEGFEVPVASGDSDGGLQCSLFVATFGADPEGSAELQMTMDLDFALHSVFYPGVMPEGEKFPLLVWGNGTCAMPEGYGALLRYVASHGYIVVAPNSRWVGSNDAMIIGLDYMFAANEDPNSMWYQKIDTSKVGAFGHSQGGMATAAAASDSRVQSVILFNGGTTASKPFLSVSGDKDLFTTAASQLANPVNAAPRPAAYLFYHMIPPTLPSGEPTGPSAGHLTLMMQPERVVEPTVGWFDMMLKGDETARQLFVGDSCGLCNQDADFEYGNNGML
jgi:pimeloyl-ACP methyl ester carboxylesterase